MGLHIYKSSSEIFNAAIAYITSTLLKDSGVLFWKLKGPPRAEIAGYHWTVQTDLGLKNLWMKLQSMAVHPAVCREGTQQPGRSLPVSAARLPARWVCTESHPKAQPVLVSLWKPHTNRSEMNRPLRPLWKVTNDIAADNILCFYIAVVTRSPLWPCDHLFRLLLKPLWCWYHWCHTQAEPELRNSSFLFRSASLSYLLAKW